MDRNPGYYHRLLQGQRNDSLEEAIRTGDAASAPRVMVAEAGGWEWGPPMGELCVYPVFKVAMLVEKLSLLKVHQLISI